jgi:hypothetical protein
MYRCVVKSVRDSATKSRVVGGRLIPPLLAAAAVLGLVVSAWAHGQTAPANRQDMRVLRAQSGDSVPAPIRALALRFPDATVTDQFQTLLAQPGPAVLVVTDAWSLRIACTVTHSLPVIAVFLPAIEFERATVGCRTKLITAVYADVSPLDHLRLITDIYGVQAKVLALVPDDAPNSRKRLETAATQLGVKLALEVVPDQTNVARVLARAQAFDVVLALADTNLYTANNVRTLLEATYRRGSGMIGFSPSTVRAGMLASAFTQPEDSLDVLAEMVTRYSQSGQLALPRHPKVWRALANETVARSLSIPLPPEFGSDAPQQSGAPK